MPSYPNLKFLTVISDLITPSDHWYFTDPSGSDPEDAPASLGEDDSSSEDFSVFGENPFDSFDPFNAEEDA